MDFSPDIVVAILEDALPDVVRLGALLTNPPVLWGEAAGGAGNGACAASGKVGEGEQAWPASRSSVYTSAMSQPRPDFLSLSVAERIQLAEDIWDSIAAESPESMALTPDQLQAVEARLGEHEQDPASAVPWDQVRTELFQRNH